MKKKRGSANLFLSKSQDIDSSQFNEDEDAEIFKLIYKKSKRKYHLSSTDILNLVQKEEIFVPSSIFTKKLSPLEIYVKYLKENLELDYPKVAELLRRSRKTVWQAYKNSIKKLPVKFKPIETRFVIPVSSLGPKLSILESTVVYLKTQFNLSYRKISQLLKRNERTVWTVYNRAQKKRKYVKV